MTIKRYFLMVCLSIIFTFAVVLYSTVAFGAIIRVPLDQPTIQAGMDAASPGDTVLVAHGIYMGDGNKNLQFRGKAITVLSESGPVNCIIDLENTGRGFFFHRGEGQDSLLSGFTIKNSQVDYNAIECVNSSSPTITNCIITGNGGSGLFCGDNSSPTITNCIISNNTADHGGAIHCVNSSPTITDCTITDNTTTYGYMIHCNNSSPSITNSTITGNTGGGIGIFGGFGNSSPTITNCIIRANMGGGILCGDSSPHIANCTISGNTADYGGAIRCMNSSPTITDCTITDNTTTDGYTIQCENSFPSITNSTITGNTGGGIGGWGDSCLTITNSAVAGNSGTGITVFDPDSCSSTITNCSITGNSQRGIKFANSSSASITNCAITGNTTEWGGAGIECVNSSPTVTNCIISNNTATLNGAGIRCRGNSSPSITNCTISNNTASGSGGGIHIQDNSSPTVTNSVLWADSPDEISIATGVIGITYSDIQGGWAGEGNIDADPRFVGGGDYHLSQGSPCIDTATDAGVYTDIDGDPRPLGAGFDMGVDEYIPRIQAMPWIPLLLLDD